MVCFVHEFFVNGRIRIPKLDSFSPTTWLSDQPLKITVSFSRVLRTYDGAIVCVPILDFLRCAYKSLVTGQPSDDRKINEAS